MAIVLSRPAKRFRRGGLTLLELLVVLVILTALGTLLVPSLSWMGDRSQRLATQENLRRLREVLVNDYLVDMGELPRPRAGLAVGGTRQDHPQLLYLFVNPDTHEDGDPTNDFIVEGTVLSGRRWNGPYVMHSGMEYFISDTDGDHALGDNFTARYGNSDLTDPTNRIGDPTITDAWGRPIVIQEPTGDVSNLNTLTQGSLSPAEIELGRRHTRLVSAGRDGRIDTHPNVLMPTLAERGDDEILFLFRHDEFNDTMLDLER
jgi:type II secretory pathway pseudopilin PulG